MFVLLLRDQTHWSEATIGSNMNVFSGFIGSLTNIISFSVIISFSELLGKFSHSWGFQNVLSSLWCNNANNLFHFCQTIVQTNRLLVFHVMCLLGSPSSVTKQQLLFLESNNYKVVSRYIRHLFTGQWNRGGNSGWTFWFAQEEVVWIKLWVTKTWGKVLCKPSWCGSIRFEAHITNRGKVITLCLNVIFTAF